MASILETNSVTKKFGGFTAVDNVTLKVDPGEIRFIIGPNGAGKSTFFKLVIGYHHLTQEQFYTKVKMSKN